MILENFAPIHLRVVLAHSTIDTNSSVDIFLIENDDHGLSQLIDEPIISKECIEGQLQ